MRLSKRFLDPLSIGGNGIHVKLGWRSLVCNIFGTRLPQSLFGRHRRLCVWPIFVALFSLPSSARWSVFVNLGWIKRLCLTLPSFSFYSCENVMLGRKKAWDDQKSINQCHKSLSALSLRYSARKPFQFCHYYKLVPIAPTSVVYECARFQAHTLMRRGFSIAALIITENRAQSTVEMISLLDNTGRQIKWSYDFLHGSICIGITFEVRAAL